MPVRIFITNILCTFSLGVGYLWLIPYKQAARAAFYREMSGIEYRRMKMNGVAIQISLMRKCSIEQKRRYP